MEQGSLAFTAVYLKAKHGYIGFIEELPGVNSHGSTIEEARETLRGLAALLHAERETRPHRSHARQRARARLPRREQRLEEVLLAALAQVPHEVREAAHVVPQPRADGFVDQLP